MNNQIILHDLMEQELERYKNLRDRMTFVQKRLPKGSLSKRNDRLIHSIRDKGVQFAITLSDIDPVVAELKTSRYIKEGLPILERKIKACEEFLKNDICYDPFEIESKLKDCYHDITDLGVFLKGDLAAGDFGEMNFRKNPMRIEIPHITGDGVKCRSKSEALIGTRLEQRGELYLYDTALELYDGSIIYSDFKIFQPRRRRLVIMEHFGMMDSPDYAEKAIKRLEKYSKSGYYLGWNLFYTYETKKHPLTIETIDRKLDEIKALDRI